MVKRALTLLTSILIALPLLMPFNIYAESIDSHIRGRNYNFEVIQTEKVNSNNIYVNSGIYHITFELDDNYIGYILPNYTIQYKNYFYGSNPPKWGNSGSSFNRRVFINGSSFSFDVPITWYSNGAFSVNGGSDPYVYDSYTVTSSDVTKTSDIDSLDQIVTILTDLYNSQDQVEGLLSNQLTQLQLVVANTSLANTYLESLTKIKQFNVPFESYGALVYLLRNKEIHQYQDIYSYNYPTFILNNGDKIFTGHSSSSQAGQSAFVIYVERNIWTYDEFKKYFSITPDSGSLINVSFERLNYNPDWSLIKIVLNTDSNTYYTVRATVDYLPLIPIFIGHTNMNTSVDFALMYGLDNELLKEIKLIANGTVQSNSAASSNDLANEQLQTESNTLFQQENNFKSDMNNAMQNVNNTFRLQDMGTKFVSSAQWVRTQYENLTNNTPFASLITFSLITGLALILLGKVYK